MMRSTFACALLFATVATAEDDFDDFDEFTIHAVAPALRELCSARDPSFSSTYDPLFEQWSKTYADRIEAQELRAKASAPAGVDVRAGVIRRFKDNARSWDAAATKSRCEFAPNALQLQLMQAESDGPSFEPIKVACALKTASAALGIVADIDLASGHVSIGEEVHAGVVTPTSVSWDTTENAGGYRITIDRASGHASAEHSAVRGLFKGRFVSPDGGTF